MESRFFNLIILDASGSMESIYEQALTGVNETLQTIRIAQSDMPELKQFISLASFSAGKNYLNRIYNALPIDGVRNITREDYPLLGCTALYDAMGEMISETQQHVTHDDRVLVTVITDGYENASKTWDGEHIKFLVEELRQMGWTFTYIGANQDVDKVAASIGVRNSLHFCADAEGTSAMFKKERKSRNRLYGKMKDCLQKEVSYSLMEEEDYFNE